MLRPGIKRLADGSALFAANAQAPTTAGEVMKLITNMADEAYYLPSMRAIVQRYTNDATQPNAAQALRETTASQGFTGALTVFFYAHGRANAAPLLQNDGSYSAALTRFAQANKAAPARHRERLPAGRRHSRRAALHAIPGAETGDRCRRKPSWPPAA